MAKSSFVKGILVLIITGFIVRILGFVYRIYLSNLIGAEGMGLFQLIFPIYSLIILTLTSGISIAVSKMVAVEAINNRPDNLRRIVLCALTIVISLGILVSAITLYSLDFLVSTILKDPRTYLSLILLIPCIPIIAGASVLKGYFYGMQDTVPTALSQVAEQVVRISFVMLIAGWLINAGLEYACAVATVGTALGEIINLIVLAVIYKFKTVTDRNSQTSETIRKRAVFSELVIIALPISLNRFITSTISAFENILIPKRLLAGGMAYTTSLSEFGRLTGMAMPVLFFPALITSSLATMLVPTISEGISVKSNKAVNYRISKSVQLTITLGFIFFAIFISFPNEISNLIYKRERIGDIIYNLSFACVFLYLQQTLLGVLNGLGKQGISLRNSIVGYGIRIGFVYYFIPVYGLQGYIWGIIASSVTVCVLNMAAVIKTTEISFSIKHWILKPGFVGLILIFSSKYIYSFCEIFALGIKLTTAMTVLGSIFVGIGLMIVAGILKKGEIKRFLGVKY